MAIANFFLRFVGLDALVPERSTDMNRQKPTKRVCDIDLTAVMMKLMEPEPEGKGWSLTQAEVAEKWYRRFLTICQLYPKFPVVPNYYIDTFWHQHILDTKAYAKDCQAVFGYFIHHYPYFGLNGEEDKQNRDNAFVDTNALYRKHFGEDCTAMLAEMKHKMAAGPCVTGNDMVAESPNPEQTGCRNNCRGGTEAPVFKKAAMASGCSAPCVPEACSGGGTCSSCTVDGDNIKSRAMVASGCNHGGSGTGCGQGCGRK